MEEILYQLLYMKPYETMGDSPWLNWLTGFFHQQYYTLEN